MDTRYCKYNNSPIVVTQHLSDSVENNSLPCISEANAIGLIKAIFGKKRDSEVSQAVCLVDTNNQLSSSQWPHQQ